MTTPDPDYAAIEDITERRRVLRDTIARKSASVPKADHNGRWPGEWQPPTNPTPPAAA